MPASLSSFDTDWRKSARALSACCLRSAVLSPAFAAEAVRAASSWLPAADRRNDENGLLASPGRFSRAARAADKLATDPPIEESAMMRPCGPAATLMLELC